MGWKFHSVTVLMILFAGVLAVFLGYCIAQVV